MIERAYNTQNFEFLMLIGILFMLGVMRQTEGERLSLFIRGFFNASLIGQQARQERSFIRLAIPVLLLTLSVLSLFLAYTTLHFDLDLNFSLAQLFVMFICGLIGLTLFRSAVYNGLASLFEVRSVLSLFNFEWVLSNFILSLFLIPILILHAFGPESVQTAMIFLGIISVSIFYILRSLRQFRVVLSELRVPLVYNVLYFCALEILPPMVIIVGILR